MGAISCSERDGVRYLHFGTRWVQGAMRIGRPERLELAYVRDMMAWLLLLDPPIDILQLGLGAASLTGFCHRHMPESRVTVVEIDPMVVSVARQWFALPAEDDRLTIRLGDAGRVVRDAALAGRFGVIQVDLYDAEAAGPVRDSARFYRDCHRLLAEPGVMVVNLFGRHASFRRSVRRVAASFDQWLVLEPIEAGNQVLLAFKGPPIILHRAWLQQRGRWIRRRFGLASTRWIDAHRAAFPTAAGAGRSGVS